MQYKLICYWAENGKWKTHQDIRNTLPVCINYPESLDEAKQDKAEWEKGGLNNYTYLADIYEANDHENNWTSVKN